jgi:hypothetical protein
MALWRQASERESRDLGHAAIIAHAAVSTAIVNTIAGKDVPEFQKMVDRLSDSASGNGTHAHVVPIIDREDALVRGGFERPVNDLSDMEEF